MGTGFVYIMFNPSMRGLVKIGLTKRAPSDRLKELRATGVPDDFVLVYDELVTDCELVESNLHRRFHGYRYQPNREFFQIPIRDAIRGLIEEADGYVVPRIGSRYGVEIFAELKKKYPNYLKPDIQSIKIIHKDNLVYLESVRYPNKHNKNEVVERTDLEFIREEDGSKMFLVSREPSDNARIFVHELNSWCLLNCTDLFAIEAYVQIVDDLESCR